LKQLSILLLLCCSGFFLQAQVPADSVAQAKTDSLLAGQADTAILGAATDSIIALQKDSIQLKPLPAVDKYQLLMDSALRRSTYLNSKALPTAMANKQKSRQVPDAFFYVLLGILVLLSFLKLFFNRYFFNLFRVFFNTSLRQGQLTDQLLQARQASVLFNLLFAIIGGVYVYFLLKHYNWLPALDVFLIMLLCVISVAAIYFFKFITLKFTGWLTGYTEAVNTYLFIIFLVNKILGVLLIPLVIVIAFSPVYIAQVAVIISLLLTAALFLLRFIRSYNLLHRQIKVSRFHFFLYIAGIELLPVLLIYKGVVILLDKKL
jgi:hypothetical protein